MPAGGLLTGSLISGGTSLLSGIFGKNAADKAAQIQANAAKAIADKAGVAAGTATKYVSDATSQAQGWLGGARDTATGDVNTAAGSANDILGNVFGLQSGVVSPYLQGGATGIQGLQQFLQPGGPLSQQFSFDPSQIANDPGYQFQLQQGTQAIQQSNAAKGLLNSGATLKDLTNYSQGLAGTEYQNAYNRALSTFQTNRQGALSQLGGLTSLAGFGLPAASQFNTAASNYGNLASGNTLGAGYFGGNTALNTATQAGQWGIGGAQYGGNAALQATQIGAQAMAGGANAQAAGVVGGTNALTSGLTGASNAIQPYFMLPYLSNLYGSGFGGGGSTPMIPGGAGIGGYNPNVAKMP